MAVPIANSFEWICAPKALRARARVSSLRARAAKMLRGFSYAASSEPERFSAPPPPFFSSPLSFFAFFLGSSFPPSVGPRVCCVDVTPHTSRLAQKELWPAIYLLLASSLLSELLYPVRPAKTDIPLGSRSFHYRGDRRHCPLRRASIPRIRIEKGIKITIYRDT